MSDEKPVKDDPTDDDALSVAVGPESHRAFRTYLQGGLAGLLVVIVLFGESSPVFVLGGLVGAFALAALFAYVLRDRVTR